MPDVVDKASQRYGWLAVLQQVGRNKRGHALWECVCLCGNTTVVSGDNLRNAGGVRSCGCWRRLRMTTRNTTHGMKGTPEYHSWRSACSRTTNPNDPAWVHYGGRGIDIDPQWVGPGSFERFYAVMGPRPEGHTLDRIDNDKGYWPDNCRWADAKTQANNKRPKGN